MVTLLITASVLVVTFLCVVLSRILYVSINNLLVRRKANMHGDPDLCCCGAMLEQHSMLDNHSFVSEVDYFLECNLKKF